MDRNQSGQNQFGYDRVCGKHLDAVRRTCRRGNLSRRMGVRLSEAVDTSVSPPLYLHVALELFQSLERDFERMPLQPAGLGVMVRGAGWQVAVTANLSSIPFSQQPAPPFLNDSP